MQALTLAAALTLTAVFGVAGIAKLIDRKGTGEALHAFGAPAFVVPVLALVLPLAELAVAAALLVPAARIAGAAGAVALLSIFSAAIAVSLARGRTPDCHCFGQIHSSPASWRTLVRNGVLAGVAGLSLAAGLAGETPNVFVSPGGVSRAEIAVAALGLAVIVTASVGAFAFFSLVRSYGGALLRLEAIERRLAEAGLDLEEDESPPEIGHEPGTLAPGFAAADVHGELVSLDDLLAPGLPLLLLFTSPTCGPCEALMPEVAAWQAEHAGRLTIAIADAGEREAGLAKAEDHGLERVLVDHELAIQAAYDSGATPSAVLVAPDGTISSYVAPGADWIARLLEHALTAPAESEEEGPPIGSPAPELMLSTLDATPFSFASTHEESLVLFWNPDCGFCSSMRDDLLAWERDQPVDAPRLVVVSSGEVASVRAEGFSSTVVLDPEFIAGTAFGAGGTPMAILLDSAGRVASPLAAGAEAVFALAGGRRRGDAASLAGMRELVAP